MADNQRTLTLAIKADIEVARTQLENLVGIMGKSAADVDARLGHIEDAFDRTSKHVSVRSQTLATTIGSTIGSTLGSLLGQIPGALISMTQSAIESAGSIKNTAEALGISTDALQDFRIGATSAGVDVKKADAALEAFTKTTGKAASGNKTAADAFKAIGVDIADSQGRLKPFEQLLGEVADGLAKMSDPARQAAAAQKLFGETGTDLLPFLRDGSKGINDLAAANELLGLKLSPETIEKLDQLGNKADAVRQVFTAQMATAIGNNADAIIGLGNAAAGAVGYLAEVLAYVKGLAAVRVREGFLAQFTSDFDRTAALGKPGGQVAVYGQEYADARTNRIELEAKRERATGGRARMLDDKLYFARDKEEKARTLYRAAVAESEANRADAPKGAPPPAPGGMVVAPPGKPPPKPKAAPKAKKSYDLQGETDKVLAGPAQLSKGLNDQGPLAGYGLADKAPGKELMDAMNKIGGSAETMGETLAKAFDKKPVEEFAKNLPVITSELDLARDAGQAFIADMAFGLASIITQSGDMGDKIVSVLARIGESWIQSGIMNFLSGGREGTSFGTIFKGVTSIFGAASAMPSIAGARAGGGPVQEGLRYLVGENGPEIIEAPMNGTVIPTHALRAAAAGAGDGGRGAIYNSFDLRGALVTEDVLARIDAMGNQAAVRGAVGGKQMARTDSARRQRRRLG